MSEKMIFIFIAIVSYLLMIYGMYTQRLEKGRTKKEKLNEYLVAILIWPLFILNAILAFQRNVNLINQGEQSRRIVLLSWFIGINVMTDSILISFAETLFVQNPLLIKGVIGVAILGMILSILITIIWTLIVMLFMWRDIFTN